MAVIIIPRYSAPPKATEPVHDERPTAGDARRLFQDLMAVARRPQEVAERSPMDLGNALAFALAPDRASPSQWEQVLAACVPHARAIATSRDAMGHGFDAQLRSLLIVGALRMGGDVALDRFAHSFGSDAWTAWTVASVADSAVGHDALVRFAGQVLDACTPGIHGGDRAHGVHDGAVTRTQGLALAPLARAMVTRVVAQQDGALTPYVIATLRRAAGGGALDGLRLADLVPRGPQGWRGLSAPEQAALNEGWPLAEALMQGGPGLSARIGLFRTGHLSEPQTLAQALAPLLGRDASTALRARHLAACPSVDRPLLESLMAALSTNWVAQAEVEKGLLQRLAGTPGPAHVVDGPAVSPNGAVRSTPRA